MSDGVLYLVAVPGATFALEVKRVGQVGVRDGQLTI